MSDLPALPADFPVQKTYLGDSVYLSPGRFLGEWILTTENGYPDDPRNIIYLDPSVVFAFKERVLKGDTVIACWMQKRAEGIQAPQEAK